MGYRSEVVFAITPEVAPAFMALCAKIPSLHELCFKHHDTLESNRLEEGDYMFQWDHIKWYHSHEEISALDGFMTALESEDLSEYGEHEVREWMYGFKFVRVGEDADDVEERGYGFDDIQLNRSISF